MALDVDLSDPRTHAELDLGPLWRRLRRDDPVCLHPETARTSPFWVVTRYVDTVNVYLDAATFVSAHGNVLDTVARGGDSASGLMLPVTDGPRHRAVRQAVRAAITPRVLARPGDAVVTSDPGDLHRLLDHLRVNASIIAI